MKENTLYQFFKESLNRQFESIRVLKEEDETRILLLRHGPTGGRFILRAFPGEAAVYRKLMTVASPHLPRIYETAEENGRVLALEEYIQGDRLDDILSCSLLEEEQARLYTRQLCKALAVLHGFGAVHRDVKPENIILRGGDAVLIDFDASRIQKPENGKDTVALGTTGYAAPEQYGLGQTDGRTDIFALGVVMNVMLTGEHPSVRSVNGRMGRIIRRCTMTRPDQRYRDVTRLYEDL